jgi:hypothetical protein
MGGSKRVWGITKHEVVIQVNLIKLVKYTMIHVKAMIMQATSYDATWGAIFVPLVNHLGFWEDIVYY